MFSPFLLMTMAIWIGVCVALPVMTATGIDPGVRSVYSNILQAVAPIVSALLCYRTAFVFERGDALRQVWAFLGHGVFAWGAGAVLSALYQFINKGAETPYPWYADIGYLLMVPLIVIALLTFKRSLQVKTPLWGIIAGTLVFIGSLALAFWSSLDSLQEADTAVVYTVEIAYIVLDPTLLGLTVVSASLLAGGLVAIPWYFGLSGLFLYYLGNVLYDYLILKEQYVTGGAVDMTWPLAFGLIAIAGIMTRNMFKIGD